MRKRTKLTLSLFTCVTLAVVANMAVKADDYSEGEICFSEESSFCTADVELELSTLQPSDIYYTLDGSSPTDEDTLYEEPILLEAGEETQCYPVKAVAYYSDGTVTDVYTKTYFVGENADERFSTLVFSITGEYEDLFDYETGILVTGIIRDFYVLDNPGVTVTDADPANFSIQGDQSERTVYVEAWDAEGNKLLGQLTGLRVNGALSRSSDVKSLRLIARSEYGANRIEYDFFEDVEESAQKLAAAAAEGTEYEPDFAKRLVLRNHGNDQESGYLRNELAQRLASDAGCPVTQEAVAASVWINGEYYGFLWLEEYYDDVYLGSHYGTDSDDGSWQIVEMYSLYDEEEEEEYGWEEYQKELTEEELEEEEEKELLESRAEDDLREVLEYADMDLTDDEVFAEFEELVDVDNFLSYCAIEIYLANCDWVDNNIKAYRWYSEDGEYDDEEGTDGKWRFLIYDLDLTMQRTWYSNYSVRTLACVLGALDFDGEVWMDNFPLLKAVLQREDMRERFREIMEEYMNGAFSYSHVSEVLDGMLDEMSGELDYQIKVFAYEAAEDEGGDGEEYYRAALEAHQEEMDEIRLFFQNRPDIIRDELDNLEEYLK